LLLNKTNASFPKIEPRELFSLFAFGGVSGSVKLNNPKIAETIEATINVTLVSLNPKMKVPYF
jgi:hypothetical protein